MAFIPVPNGAEVVVKATKDGQNVYNTFNFIKTGGWGQTDLQGLVDAIDVLWGAALATLFRSGYAYVQTDGRDLRTAIGVQATANASAGNGGLTGSTLPNNVAIAVARQSGLTGRSSRGRVFFPVTDGSQLATQNTISTTFRDAVIDLLQDVNAAGAGDGWTEVVVSRQQEGVPLTTAVVYIVLQYLVIDVVLDSMRRRLPGRGA